MAQPVLSPLFEKNKLLGLDHLRAFAITFVVIFHYKFFGHPDWVTKINSFGWTGVDLFFVLSGFLIAGQLFETVKKGNPIPVREFFIKRFFRIIPPYFVVLVLYFSFPVLSEWGHLSPMWRYLTFTLNFGLDLKRYGTFSHAWSLCVEEQFYLILPLCFWLFTWFKAGSKSIYLITALFIAGFIIRFLCWKYQVEPNLEGNDTRSLFNLYIYYPTYNRLDGLLTGVSIAGLFTFYPKVKEWVNKHNNLVLLAGIIAITIAYFVCANKEGYHTTLYGFTLISVAYGIFLAAVVCPANILYKLKSTVTSQIAALSYSLYLVHKIVIHVTQVQLGKFGVDKNGNLMMACCFATTILAAVLMKYSVEKPALRWRNRILTRMKEKKVAELAIN
ncbi:MAG: acyltransferase [Bacteroidota bacterium]|nr:acyltransferase [Bacteroidota bacterium]